VPYVAPTLAQLLAVLAARLQDPTNVFWSQAELILYIQEALRTWNIMAAWYRDRMVFSTASANPWYDLSAQTNSLVPYTVTDQYLFEEIEYHLLEPPSPGVWTGSAQFDAQDLTTALQQRRDQFLLETGCVLTHSTQSAGMPADGRAGLSPSVIDVRRMSYLDSNGNYTLLWRVDENQLFAYAQGWSVNPSPVQAYSVIATPPVTVQLAPIPSLSGTLDLVTVNAGAALNPSSGVVLGVPDDLSWVVKWGALCDLLTKDGPPSDPVRAKYCEARWKEGIELARATATIMFAYLNGIQVTPVSFFDLDCDPSHPSNWQNDTPGVPGILAMGGMNLIALDPPPSSTPSSVQLDVLRNFPVPVLLTDVVQVGQEELDVITDYAEHLAAFKMSGAEFMATMPAYARMVRLAKQQNERWRAFSKQSGDNMNKAQRDFSEVRRRKRSEPVEVGSDMEGSV
jgi:hypothetical protein